MPREKRSLAQVKRDLRQRHIDNNVLHRVQRMNASSWSTDELVRQAVDEGYFSERWDASWWEIMAETRPTPERFRTYVCWQLVDARWSFYKKDPIHPIDAIPDIVPKEVDVISKKALGFT